MTDIDEIMLLMEDMEFRTLGRPSGASHATIWDSTSTDNVMNYAWQFKEGDEEDLILFLQNSDEVDLVDGTKEEVIVYYYGPNTRELMNNLATVGTSPADLDTRRRAGLGLVGQYYQVALWYSPEDRVILALPVPQSKATLGELESKGYKLLPIPWYASTEQFTSHMQRPEEEPEDEFESDFGQPV